MIRSDLFSIVIDTTTKWCNENPVFRADASGGLRAVHAVRGRPRVGLKLGLPQLHLQEVRGVHAEREAQEEIPP